MMDLLDNSPWAHLLRYSLQVGGTIDAGGSSYQGRSVYSNFYTSEGHILPAFAILR